MAVGAVTEIKRGVIGDLKYVVVTVVGAASYTTTGDALDLNAVTGINNIYLVLSDIAGPSPAVNAATVDYDATAKKLQVFGTAANVLGLTEVTAATNLSTQTYTLLVIGK